MNLRDDRTTAENFILSPSLRIPLTSSRDKPVSRLLARILHPSTYQRSNFGAHLRKLSHRYDPFALGPPFAPIQALDLIGQNRAWTRAGNHHFEGIILDLRRHRATDQQTRLRIICPALAFTRRFASCGCCCVRGLNPRPCPGTSHLIAGWLAPSNVTHPVLLPWVTITGGTLEYYEPLFR